MTIIRINEIFSSKSIDMKKKEDKFVRFQMEYSRREFFAWIFRNTRDRNVHERNGLVTFSTICLPYIKDG